MGSKEVNRLGRTLLVVENWWARGRGSMVCQWAWLAQLHVRALSMTNLLVLAEIQVVAVEFVVGVRH